MNAVAATMLFSVLLAVVASFQVRKRLKRSGKCKTCSAFLGSAAAESTDEKQELTASLVRVNEHTALLGGKAKQGVARIDSHLGVRRCDRNENMIVFPVGRYGVNTCSPWQVTDEGSGAGVDNTHCLGCATGSIEVVVT